VKGENPMSTKRFIVRGDGDSKSIAVSLEASPVGMEFRGNKKPARALLVEGIGPEVVSLSIADGILRFEFERPPAEGERAEFDIEFFYQGEI